MVRKAFAKLAPLSEVAAGEVNCWLAESIWTLEVRQVIEDAVDEIVAEFGSKKLPPTFVTTLALLRGFDAAAAL